MAGEWPAPCDCYCKGRVPTALPRKARRWYSPASETFCSPLSSGLNSSCPILLIERLADEGLDHGLTADVQLFGSAVPTPPACPTQGQHSPCVWDPASSCAQY